MPILGAMLDLARFLLIAARGKRSSTESALQIESVYPVRVDRTYGMTSSGRRSADLEESLDHFADADWWHSVANGSGPSCSATNDVELEEVRERLQPRGFTRRDRPTLIGVYVAPLAHGAVASRDGVRRPIRVESPVDRPVAVALVPMAWGAEAIGKIELTVVVLKPIQSRSVLRLGDRRLIEALPLTLVSIPQVGDCPVDAARSL